MAKKMMTFRLRRIIGVLFALALSSVICVWGFDANNNLTNISIESGLALMGMCLFLAAYNLRKKLPFIPLGKSSTWLQIHIYIGFVSILMFAIHIGGRVPNGSLEILVGSIYILVAMSGIIGLYLTRTIPKRLTARGGTIVFEEIPMLRRELRTKAEKVAIDSITETKKTTIADFYSYRLSSYFMMPSNQWTHFFGSEDSLKGIHTAMHGVRRYLNPRELEILGEIENLVIQKDTLDLQHSLQRGLKYWLFTHIPLTYGLLILGLFHAIVAWVFVGS